MRGTTTSVVVALLAALAFTCAWAPRARAARVLGLFPHPGRSHQMVFEPLLWRLAERGHHVTVVSFFPVPKEPPPPPTYRDISLVGLHKIHLAILDINEFEMNLWGAERFFGQINCFTKLADWATGICEKFLEWPAVRELSRSNETFDVILVENFNSDCMLGFARQFDAPIVALLSHTLMPWSADRLGVPDNPAYVPVMGTPFTENMTVLERLENAINLYVLKAMYRYGSQAKEQAILERHYGRKIADIDDIAKNYSVMLVNAHHSLNGVRQWVPGVVEVGGMHLERPRKTIPPNVEQFMNESEHGVVVFCFGSLIKSATLPKHRLESILKVLARIPQRVLWKWEDDNLPLASNIMTMKWMPQYELLQHPKVVAFIAHGGLLGMTEAAAAGVPMLVVPFFGDQPGNAAAAADAGLATVLQYKNLDEDHLYAALQKVLSPEMRASAVRLSRVWRDRPAPPLDTAVYWVERTARLGRDQQLASHSRHMPAYQLALLDVAAVAIGIVLALLLFLYGLAKLLLRLIKMVCKLDKVKVN